MNRALLVTLAVAISAPALAVADESGRWGSFELRVARYRPDVDAEFGGAASPYRDVFGGGQKAMFRVDVAKSLFARFGTLDLGVGAGYFQVRGHGRVPTTNEVSGDDTILRIVPTALTLTYRFDRFADTIPLVPYGRVALERYNWWVSRGTGGTASFAGDKGRGATHGYTLGAGAAFLLDIIDRGLAGEMDRDTGINDTYVFVEFARSKVDDFGSGSSIDLSSEKAFTLAGGLLFVF